MKFTVYSKEDCPYCNKVKQVLQLIEANYVVYDLDDHFTKDDFYSEFGNGTTFPQVVVDDVHIGGCTDTIKYLKENNMV